jgi:hypothetical protein
MYRLGSIHAFYIENFIYLSYKASYLNEEVNCTEPLPSISDFTLEATFKGALFLLASHYGGPLLGDPL